MSVSEKQNMIVTSNDLSRLAYIAGNKTIDMNQGLLLYIPYGTTAPFGF